MFFIKAIWTGEQAAGSKGPALLIISSVNEGLFGQIFSSGVVIDNGYGAFATDIIIVFYDIIFLPC